MYNTLLFLHFHVNSVCPHKIDKLFLAASSSGDFNEIQERMHK